MDGGAMAVLSLFEAAEQAATSKVDVWRAIQQGALPAQKTSDGGYAIDPADLFRVFRKQQPEPPPAPAEPPAPDEAPVPKADQASEAAVDDVSAAFAALQAELKSLLCSPAKAVPAGEEKPRGKPEQGPHDLSGQDGRLTDDVDADKEKAATVVAGGAAPEDKLAASAEGRRPWWRRLTR